MNRNDLRRIDFHLLIVFETLMHERSVTQAAKRLFLGQPAISAALSRLRILFNDPLFIRTGRTMEPTARAEEIFALLAPALDSIVDALSHTTDFDPAVSHAEFRIGLSDDVEFALFPSLLRSLRVEAPNVVLILRRVDYLSLPHLLNTGEISVGICYTGGLPANAKRKVLRFSRPRVLRGDAGASPLTLEDFCARPHALVSFAGDLSGYIDGRLARLGCRRRVILAIPQFTSLGALLADTDIITTVPDYIAAALSVDGRLRAEELPFDVPAFELSMAWRGALDNDPAERWLRGRLQVHTAGAGVRSEDLGHRH